MEKLASFFASYINVFKWNDLVDILIISVAVYWVIRLIRESRAEQLTKGIVILLVIMQLSDWFDLNVLNFLLTNAMQVGLLAIIILFQPEFRRGLEQMGRTKFGDIIFQSQVSNQTLESSIVAICNTAGELSRTKTGGLIVIERKTKTGDVALTGTQIDATISSELLLNIFYPNTPLHDGAVIIKDNKIKAAGCLLPLSQNNELSSELGTRHRAAIGMSENSDAIVVVVSEETGKISLARNGSLTRNFTTDTLKRALEKMLLTFDDNSKTSKLQKITGRSKK